MPSSKSMRIAARVSPYHASVTLFEAKKPEVSTPSKSGLLSDIEDIIPDTRSPSLVQKRSKSASLSKVKHIPTSLKVPHPCPQNWRETYDTIKEMRSRIEAPVDTMGCDLAHLKEKEPRVRNLSLCMIFYIN